MNEAVAYILGVVSFLCLWVVIFLLLSVMFRYLVPPDTLTVRHVIIEGRSIVSSTTCIVKGEDVDCANVSVQESNVSPG